MGVNIFNDLALLAWDGQSLPGLHARSAPLCRLTLSVFQFTLCVDLNLAPRDVE